jgi:acetylornithine deacetylase/succinyl-diaminopimelate desuccinylase-like protein
MASVEQALAERVFQRIDRQELVELAVSMGQIFAPMGREQPMSDFVAGWLERNRFKTRRYRVCDERENVVGILPGHGGGKSLILNAHMDTELTPDENVWAMVDPDEAFPRAWTEGDNVFGRSVLNDRGCMACFMMAAKALKDAGVRLQGDLIQAMVIGEVDMAPIDEFKGARYEGIGFGTRFLLDHGVTADYAVVAETTDFAVVWQECGVAYFKITTYGQTAYTPRSTRTARIQDHPNAIVKMAYLIQQLEDWGRRYEEENTRDYENGRVTPKVVVGAIRGGTPQRPARTSGVCACYMDVRVLPDRSITDVERELRSFVDGLGLGADVEMYLSKRGHIGRNVEPLRDAVINAHRLVVGGDPAPGSSDERSMWRDINLYNEWGIPALTYGPTRHVLQETPDAARKGGSDPGGKLKCFRADDLANAAKVYALLAMQICGVKD